MATLLDAFTGLFARRQSSALPAPKPVVTVDPRQKLAYAGAKRDRTNADWNANRSGPNREVSAAILPLRDRSRDLARNNPHARKALETLAANIIGTGIQATYNDKNETLQRTINDAWQRWQEELSAESDLDWVGLQHLAVMSWLESGDVLLRRRWRRVEDGLAVPLQVELIEGDQLWEEKTTTLPTGGRVVQGVEFDPIGRRTAYWILREHPSEGGSVPTTGGTGYAVRVDAADVAHLYRPTRPKQVRGVPWLSAVILALRDLEAYQISERVRKRAQAGLVGVVTPKDDAVFDADTTDSVGTTVTDSSGETVDEIEPGQWYVARNGANVTFSTPTSDAGYPEWVTTQLRTIAAGVLLTHEQLSGDLSQVNYSSIRLGMLEFQRLTTILQRQIVVPLLCRKVWGWFIEGLIASGQIPAGTYRPQWVMPHREEIDRITAVQAAILEIRAGLKARAQEIQARGGNPEEIQAAIQAEAEMARAADLWFDSDPNKANGQAAPVQTPA